LPLIEVQLEKRRGDLIFATLDLENWFFHVPVDEDSVKYTAFVTPNGHYEFLKSPFGLCIAPLVFQWVVNNVFRDILGKGFMLVYMDDLVVISNIKNKNIKRLKIVLKTVADYGLNIK